MAERNNYPKLHNAMWPGLVGKGPDAEPIDLETMLELTAAAEVDGSEIRRRRSLAFDPHMSSIRATTISQACWPTTSRARISRSARSWRRSGRRPAGVGDGRAGRAQALLSQVRKACRIGKQMRELGVRPTGGIRIDSSPASPTGPRIRRPTPSASPQTFREACEVAAGRMAKLVAEGEICWGGMHSWREHGQLLEDGGMPETLGFQADMAHTLLFTLGYNAPEDRLLPRITTGRTARRSTPPTRSWPPRCGPGPSISMSRRTTAR